MSKEWGTGPTIFILEKKRTSVQPKVDKCTEDIKEALMEMMEYEPEDGATAIKQLLGLKYPGTEVLSETLEQKDQKIEVFYVTIPGFNLKNDTIEHLLGRLKILYNYYRLHNQCTFQDYLRVRSIAPLLNFDSDPRSPRSSPDRV